MAEDKKQEKKEEGGTGTSAEPKVIRLSDVRRTGEGRYDFAGIEASEGTVVSGEVFRAQQAQLALDAAVKEGKILPAQRAHFEKMALSDLAGFNALVATMKPQVDLSERGIAGGGAQGDTELKQIDQRMRAEMAKKRAADGKLTEPEALVLVASEHPDWAERRRTLLLSETKEN